MIKPIYKILLLAFSSIILLIIVACANLPNTLPTQTIVAPSSPPSYELPYDKVPLPYGENQNYVFPSYDNATYGYSLQILRLISDPREIPAWRYWAYSTKEGNIVGRAPFPAPDPETMHRVIVYFRVSTYGEGDHYDPLYFYSSVESMPTTGQTFTADLSYYSQDLHCAEPDYEYIQKPYSIPEDLAASLYSKDPSVYGSTNIDSLLYSPPKPWYFSPSISLQSGEVREGWMICYQSNVIEKDNSVYATNTDGDRFTLWPPLVESNPSLGQWVTIPDVKVWRFTSEDLSDLNTTTVYSGPVDFTI